MIQPPGNCPVCKRIDFVQKVSALYHNSFSTTTELQTSTTFVSSVTGSDSAGNPTYGSVPQTTYSTVPVTHQTRLGALLNPPQLKKIPLPVGEKIILWLCPVLAIALYVGPASLFPHLFGRSGTDPAIALVLLVIFSMCGLSIGLPVLLGFLTHRVFFRRANEHRRELQQHEQEHWQSLLRQWEQFCYCSRCDCVFSSGDEKAVPPQQLQRLYSSG